MKAAPLRWVFWLLVGVVAFGLYQRVSRAPGPEAQTLEAETTQAQERLARVQREAADANAAIDSAIAKSADFQAQQQGRAVFVSEMALVSVLKMAMTECYYSEGHWPSDGCGVDLEDFRGELLQTVQIGEEGLIQMRFAAGYGLPAVDLQLKPSVNSLRTEWKCSSPNYDEIQTLVRHCRYAPGVP